MKIIKIIFIFLFMFILSGCNNSYQSLNDLSIVSSILIDKSDDKYITYIELYKEQKNDNKSDKLSYFIKGTGDNIQDAINNASNSISKNLYLVHTNAVIISDNVAKNDINEIFNYLESKVEMNSNYYLLISNNIDNLIESKDEDNNILGEKISNTLKYSSNSGTMVNYDFMEKLKNYISKNRDIYLSNIELKDEKITISDGYYFSGNKLVGTLSNEELKLINLFKDTKNLYFNFDYDNNQYILKIDSSKVNYNINNDINIDISIKANIVEIGSNINIDKSDSIDKLNNNSSKYLEIKLSELLNKLKYSNSDILGINDYIYRIYGKKIKDFFKDNININIKVDISKKGLVNNTLGGSYEEE